MDNDRPFNQHTYIFFQHTWIYEYVFFALIKEKPKTSVWGCYNKRSGDILGEVKWYAPWRQYCFFPTARYTTIFNAGCMKDIVEFIEIQMAKRKAKKDMT